MKLANKGRYGDTELRNVKGELSHVNPQEASLIDLYMGAGEEIVSQAGSGTINPETGLREYHYKNFVHNALGSAGHWQPINDTVDFVEDILTDDEGNLNILGLGDEWNDAIYDDEGNTNILGFGDEWNQVFSEDWKPLVDFNDWIGKDVGRLWYGDDAVYLGDGVYYTGEDRNDDGVIDKEDADLYQDTLDEDDTTPDGGPSDEWLGLLEGKAGQVQEEVLFKQQEAAKEIDPTGSGGKHGKFRGDITDLMTSSAGSDSIGARIQAVEDAPQNIIEGGPGQFGTTALDTLASEREIERGNLITARNVWEGAEGPLAAGKLDWEAAKLAYSGIEKTYDQAGNQYVSSAEITNVDHQNDTYGFQDDENTWHYWQGIDPENVDAADKITDNTETDWVDESRYTSGILGQAREDAADAGMTNWQWDADFVNEDGSTGKWVEGTGLLGHAANTLETAQGVWAEEENLFRQGGEYYWMNNAAPEGYTPPEGHPDSPPDYAVPGAEGHWVRGTWGQAQDTRLAAIESYNIAKERFGTGNQSAWDIWRDNINKLGADAKEAGMGGASDAAQTRVDAAEVLRQTKLAGSGSIERARDLDIQDISQDYGSIMGDWTRQLGATRRRLDETLLGNKYVMQDASDIYQGAEGDYIAAHNAYGSDIANEEGVRTGIFGAYDRAVDTREAAEQTYGLAEEYELDMIEGVTTAQTNYTGAGDAYAIGQGDFALAYGQYGPPISEYDPASDFFDDELSGVPGMDDGGQIYDDFAAASDIWTNQMSSAINSQGWDLSNLDDTAGWGTDYTGANWLDPGLDMPGGTGGLSSSYQSFQTNTLGDWGAPEGWEGGNDYTQGIGSFANAGSAYTDLYDYLQPSGGFKGNVDTAIGQYRTGLSDVMSGYMAGMNQAGLGGVNTVQDYLLQNATETITPKHREEALLDAQGIMNTVWGGHGSTEWESGLMKDWGASPDALSVYWGQTAPPMGSLQDYSYGSSKLPGYNTITGTDYAFSDFGF